MRYRATTTPAGARTFTPRFCLRIMQRLREFYQRYKQYILSDGLMYLAFILALVLMFVFFG